MKRVFSIKIILVVVSFAFGLTLFGQNDSITFMDAKWKTKRVSKGLKYSSFHFKGNLFASNQFVSILSIDPNMVKIDIVADTVLKPTSEFFSQSKALAAVNGSFFDMAKKKRPYNSVVYIRVDGEEIAPNQLNGNNGRGFHQQGAISVFRDIPYIRKSDNSYNWEDFIESEDVITTGPLLKIDGELESLSQHPFNKNRHPRTVVAKVSDDLVYLIVVDGRSSESAGMSLFEVQQMLNWLGAKDAINLDGGGSSTMCVKSGPRGNKVVNHPSDNKKFDNFGERNVANAIIVSKKH